MRVIVQAVKRSPYVAYITRRLPEAEVVVDEKGLGAFDTFIRCLERQGDDAAIQLEDDIWLVEDFPARVREAIAGREQCVVQLFSMRAADLTHGSRWERTFSMNQATYFPIGYGTMLAEYAPKWAADRSNIDKHQPKRVAHLTPSTIPRPLCGKDLFVNDWLQSRRERHWVHVPSLVQHREAPSRIGPRSSKRQSQTFRSPWR